VLFSDGDLAVYGAALEKMVGSDPA
jgi:hypothetical protein